MRSLKSLFLGALVVAGGFAAHSWLASNAAQAQVIPPAVIVDRDPIVDALQDGAWAGPGIHDSPNATAGNVLMIEATGNRQDVVLTLANAGATRLDVFNPPGVLLGQVAPGTTTAILFQLQAPSSLTFNSVDIGAGTKTRVRWVIRKV